MNEAERKTLRALVDRARRGSLVEAAWSCAGCDRLDRDGLTDDCRSCRERHRKRRYRSSVDVDGLRSEVEALRRQIAALRAERDERLRCPIRYETQAERLEARRRSWRESKRRRKRQIRGLSVLQAPPTTAEGVG